jgi:hypothetical protein
MNHLCPTDLNLAHSEPKFQGPAFKIIGKLKVFHTFSNLMFATRRGSPGALRTSTLLHVAPFWDSWGSPRAFMALSWDPLRALFDIWEPSWRHLGSRGRRVGLLHGVPTAPDAPELLPAALWKPGAFRPPPEMSWTTTNVDNWLPAGGFRRRLSAIRSEIAMVF